MEKRLKTAVKSLRSAFWPGNWPIRLRLLTAGVALSVLALLAPLYMRGSLSSLASTYNWTARNWETLDRIHELDQLVTDTDSKLRAFATSGNRDWLGTVTRNLIDMDLIFEDLAHAVGDKLRRAALLKETSYLYERWKREVVAANTTRRVNLKAFAQLLMSEPIAMRIHVLLNQLSRDIKDNTIVANHAVLRASDTAVLVVTYGGVFFFIGFVALIVSLWYTLIPGLNALLVSARELKRGNLDHRVHLPGSHETAQLARAFNEMAVSLKAQNEKLKELNRIKNDFVSTVSHELRTPLTAIKGSIGLILGNVTGPIPPETAEMLNITQKNTDRLIRLINEVLDVAKIEAGAIQMHFDKYGLIETIGHAILGIEAFAQTQGIRIVWDRPHSSPLVVIDRDRIEQVITNLLSNAIKFTDPGGTVTVRCFWEGDRVVIEVSDTGQGIPDEFLDRIFQKFQQVEVTANKNKEGTGLGLTIAKAIVEEHGGSIWVNSNVGQGSIFAFSLPWNGTEFVEAKKPQENQASPIDRKRILVVDNESDFTTVLGFLLEHEGYEVLTSNSGRDGIELARKHKPDLILLDVMMPELDGFTVRRVLAKTPETKSIPVFFVTVSGEVRNEPELRNATHVITKPIVAETLKTLLKQHFNSTPGPSKKAA